MSTIQKPYVERRRAARMSPKGSVVLSAGEHVEHGRIANLSSGGLLAITGERVSTLAAGAAVEVELRLDAASSEWLRFPGQVVRSGGSEIAVELDPGAEPFMHLVEEVRSASGEHQRVRTVVLVDATAERRGRIAEAFRASGCAVLEVSTPLEAIVRLGESPFEPELIAIADSLPSSISDDLRAFVQREHPRAKLVTIADDLLAPPESARCLSSSDAHGDLLVQIRELLRG